jgi:hypothetical protein
MFAWLVEIREGRWLGDGCEQARPAPRPVRARTRAREETDFSLTETPIAGGYFAVVALAAPARGAAGLRPGFLPRFFGAFEALAAFGRPGFLPRFLGTVMPSAFSLLALRSSRNFLILVLGKSLCLAQTIPKTGAAGFLQPGTGQSWSGAFFLGFFAGAFAITSWGIAEGRRAFGGLPRRLATAPLPPSAAKTAERAWASASASMTVVSWAVNDWMMF